MPDLDYSLSNKTLCLEFLKVAQQFLYRISIICLLLDNKYTEVKCNEMICDLKGCYFAFLMLCCSSSSHIHILFMKIKGIRSPISCQAACQFRKSINNNSVCYHFSWGQSRTRECDGWVEKNGFLLYKWKNFFRKKNTRNYVFIYIFGTPPVFHSGF